MRTDKTIPHSKACFVGELPSRGIPEFTGRWAISREACDEHKKEALLTTGEGLFAFLERRTDTSYPLEGAGLNYLINPVGILSHRAWCDFQFDSPAVFEEVFQSETYFDFYVQHAEDAQNFFEAFYQTYQSAGGKHNFFDVLLILRRTGFETEKTLDFFLNMWNLQLALQNQLKEQGLKFIQSPDHARATFLSVYGEISVETLHKDVVNKMLARLIELGDQRFQQYSL